MKMINVKGRLRPPLFLCAGLWDREQAADFDTINKEIEKEGGLWLTGEG